MLVLVVSLITTAKGENFVEIVTEEMVPLSYLDKTDNKIKGIHTELLIAALDEAGIKYNIRILPWARAFKLAQLTPNTLIYTIGRTPNREDDFVWIQYVFDITYHLYALKDNPKITDSEDELKKLSIAVSKDDAAHVFLDKRGFNRKVYISDYDQMLNLLFRNRVDLIASNNVGITQIIENNPHYKDKLTRVSASISPHVKSYFAMNRNSDKQLVDKIKNGFNKLKAKGTYDKIMSKLPEFLLLPVSN